MNGHATTTDEYISAAPQWQQGNLILFRDLVHKVCPAIHEEIKWGVPIFILNGKMVFGIASFKAHTKYNFIANGAQLHDAAGLFNNGLESKKSRSIDLHQGQKVGEDALEDLIKQAVDKL